MKKAKDNSLMGIELYSCTNKVVLKEMLAQTLACLDIVCRVLKKTWEDWTNGGQKK